MIHFKRNFQLILVLLFLCVPVWANEILKTERCVLIPLIYPETLQGFVFKDSAIIQDGPEGGLRQPEMIDKSSAFAHGLWDALREESTGKACSADHSSEEATTRWIERKKKGFNYLWAVTRRDTEKEEVIGFVSIWPSLISEDEKVFFISGGGAEAFRKQRFGSEVLTTVLKYAHEKLGATVMRATALETNIASQRLQESVGFTKMAEQPVQEDQEPKVIYFEMKFR